MSPAAARALPQQVAPRPAAAPRVHLELVSPPVRSQSRVPFLIMCMAILVAALLGALVLNTSMARASFEMSELRLRISQIAQDSQDLQARARAAEAGLADTARELGMVPAQMPQMLRLSDGTVLGGATTP